LFRIPLTFPELASVLTYNLPSRTTNQTGVGTSFPLLRKVVKFMFLCPSSIGKGCVSPASVKIFSYRSRVAVLTARTTRPLTQPIIA
jgi:hypothetical protein